VSALTSLPWLKMNSSKPLKQLTSQIFQIQKAHPTRVAIDGPYAAATINDK
jgi:hypothetical protein